MNKKLEDIQNVPAIEWEKKKNWKKEIKKKLKIEKGNKSPNRKEI